MILFLQASEQKELVYQLYFATKQCAVITISKVN